MMNRLILNIGLSIALYAGCTGMTVALAQDASAHRHGSQLHHRDSDQQPPLINESRVASRPMLFGQYAFATLAEIVRLLEADPLTDWSRVDIEALRQHLIDMDRVTLHAEVSSVETDDGVRFVVTGEDAATVSSIQRMTLAHVDVVQKQPVGTGTHEPDAATADFHLAPELIANGVELLVLAKEPTNRQRIRALGYIGIMTLGAHHQAHHWRMATGDNPHAH